MNKEFEIENVTKYGTDYLKEYIRVTDAEHRLRQRPRSKWQIEAELIEAELRWRHKNRNR